MKTRTDHHQQLWRDAMDEGLPEDLGRESLDGLLSGVRSRRRRRAAVRRSAAGIAAVAAVLVTVLCWRDAGETVPPVVSDKAVAPVGETLPAPEVSYLNDEELFALFDGEPVGIVLHEGRQEFIMLGGE